MTALISLDKRPRLNELQQQEGKHYETRVCVCVLVHNHKSLLHTEKCQGQWESPFGPCCSSQGKLLLLIASREELFGGV